MAIYDQNQLSVLINGYEIRDWASGADALKLAFNNAAGTLKMGSNGSGVFVANNDRSATLTLKLQQHSADNKYLNGLRALQDGNLKAFVPLTLEVRDLLNEDLISATKGYFTTRPEVTRGSEANDIQWVIVFERANVSLEQGVA
ncbi:phage structural protein [Pseudomonas solani]|uniref:phage structural protein n=1 Tax=Pseudomonas solani TaxID=2731552 RepID=UPI003F4AC051